MPIAMWTPELSLGVESLDADHRQLIDTLNQVFDALLFDRSSSALHGALATLNDYGYLEDPKHKNDSRWVHRPTADPQRYAQRLDAESLPGRVYHGFRDLIELRKALPALSGGKLEVFSTQNGSVLGFSLFNDSEKVLILVNFSERDHAIPEWVVRQNLLDQKSVLFGKAEYAESGTLWLPSYACVVFG